MHGIEQVLQFQRELQLLQDAPAKARLDGRISRDGGIGQFANVSRDENEFITRRDIKGGTKGAPAPRVIAETRAGGGAGAVGFAVQDLKQLHTARIEYQ